MPGAIITGWGYDVPERILTSRDLERMVGPKDKWIRFHRPEHGRRPARVVVASADEDPTLLEVVLDPAAVAPARGTLPALDHIRLI